MHTVSDGRQPFPIGREAAEAAADCSAPAVMGGEQRSRGGEEEAVTYEYLHTEYRVHGSSTEPSYMVSYMAVSCIPH